MSISPMSGLPGMPERGLGCVWGTDGTTGEGERECVMSSASTKCLPTAYHQSARLAPRAQCAQSELSEQKSHSLSGMFISPQPVRELIWGSPFHAFIVILFYPKPSSSRQCPSLLMGKAWIPILGSRLTHSRLAAHCSLSSPSIASPSPDSPSPPPRRLPALAVAISPHPLAHLTDCHRR